MTSALHCFLKTFNHLSSWDVIYWNTVTIIEH
jgi:hypothetical protein